MLQSEQFSAHLLRRTKEDDKKDLTRTGLSTGLSTDGLIVLRTLESGDYCTDYNMLRKWLSHLESSFDQLNSALELLTFAFSSAP